MNAVANLACSDVFLFEFLLETAMYRQPRSNAVFNLRFAAAAFSTATMLICALVFNGPLRADEGMWLLNSLPVEHLKKVHGFEPDQKWSEHLMKSCVRFNVGGSASFVPIWN